MCEPIITKRCSKCKQIKAISEFHKDYTTSDGLASWCKVCREAYRQSPKGKKEQCRANRKYYQKNREKELKRAHKYSQTEKGQEYKRNYYKKNKEKVLKYLCKYHQTEKGKEATRHAQYKYHQTKKGKETRHRSDRKHRLKYPERIKARHAITHAIRNGKLSHPNTLLCHYCPKHAQQYHHWHGYEPEYRFDVVPICQKCHIIHDRNNVQLKLILK